MTINEWMAVVGFMVSYVGALFAVWRYLSTQLKEIRTNHGTLQLHVAENYMRKDEIKDSLQRIEDKLDRIEQEVHHQSP